MKRTAGEEFVVVSGMSPAANEELPGMANLRGSLARPQSGWDPYEVWKTRLKRSTIATQEREPLPADEAARAAGPAVAHDP